QEVMAGARSETPTRPGTSRPDCGESRVWRRNRPDSRGFLPLVGVFGRLAWLLHGLGDVFGAAARLRLAPPEVLLERRREPRGPALAFVRLGLRHAPSFSALSRIRGGANFAGLPRPDPCAEDSRMALSAPFGGARAGARPFSSLP